MVVKAALLPPELRGDIEPSRDVEVSVRDLGPIDRKARLESLFRDLRALDEGEPAEETDAALRRVNELRDEWER